MSDKTDGVYQIVKRRERAKSCDLVQVVKLLLQHREGHVPLRKLLLESDGVDVLLNGYPDGKKKKKGWALDDAAAADSDGLPEFVGLLLPDLPRRPLHLLFFVSQSVPERLGRLHQLRDPQLLRHAGPPLGSKPRSLSTDDRIAHPFRFSANRNPYLSSSVLGSSVTGPYRGGAV